MARCLIIGCGCRGGALADELRARGHAVRATTRDAGRAAALVARGVDARLGDPDRVATIAPALEHVSVLCLLLGSASGTSDHLAELHGTRLEMLLLRALDSTVRGIVYEARGSVEPAVLQDGAQRVQRFCEASRIPWALIDSEPDDLDAWNTSSLAAIGAVIGIGQ